MAWFCEIEVWVSSFVTGRKHKVCANGILSTLVEVTNGISQDSVLIPVVFVLYINDLPGVVNKEVYLFAGDSKIDCDITDPTDSDSLQEDPNNLKEWLDKWLLAFHPERVKSYEFVTELGSHTTTNLAWGNNR